MIKTTISILALTTSLAVGTACASEVDFLDMSLQELADIEVTSVSKRSEKASEVAAAIHVITQEDIKNSGATSIPEVLRLAPGIQVARAGAHEWAISARGFNAQFANKLLVLIDGRTVYTPLFSGVFWDVQDTLLEDVDRIEVIRGPGGTIWGANAVNGVINIITKKSEDTQGNFARVLHGNLEHSSAFRHGGQAGEKTHYRAYGQYKNMEEFDTANGTANDEWKQWRAGMRVDKQLEEYGTVMVDVGGYDSAEDADLTLPSLSSPTLTQFLADEWETQGGHINSQWNHEVGKNQYSLQAYYDWASRDTFPFSHNTHTVDLDFNHSLSHFEGHELMWGLGYRYINSDIEGTPILNFTPEQREDMLFTAFMQDKIALLPEELFLTLGSKFEHNNYSGYEWQPGARLTWLPTEGQTVWASVTRAVKTPAMGASSQSVSLAAIPSPAGTLIAKQIGNPRLDSEVLIAYEAGYRVQPTDTTSLDFAVFYNDFKTLVGDSRAAPYVATDSYFGTHLVLPFNVNNSASGETLGFEVAGNWRVNKDWSLNANYSFIDMNLNGGSTFVSGEANTPQHQFTVQSHYDIGYGWQFDNIVRYVDELTPSSGLINDYVQLDTQISWESDDGLRLSLVGQNLLDGSHPEFSPFLYYGQQVEVPRAVYAKASWQF